MIKTYFYLPTPRDLIKAEKLLLDNDIDVVVRPAKEKIFGVCNMALEIEYSLKDNAIKILEEASFNIIVKDIKN